MEPNSPLLSLKDKAVSYISLIETSGEHINKLKYSIHLFYNSALMMRDYGDDSVVKRYIEVCKNKLGEIIPLSRNTCLENHFDILHEIFFNEKLELIGAFSLP
jgi:hypothetical protein